MSITTSLALVLSSVNASAQTLIQTKFEIKRGWIYLSNLESGLSFDSIVDSSRQNIPTDYIQLEGYKVVLYGAGALYVFRPGQKTTSKADYPDPKRGGWPAELIAYADNKLLFLSITDGYIRPRR